MSTIQPFNFDSHEVRVVTIDGEPWFVGKDVCSALAIANHRDALGRLDQDGVGNADVIDSMGRSQASKIINEAGLYELIFQSRKVEALRFKRWVTQEVIPSIRKTGSYGVQELTGPELMARALQEAASTIEAREARIKELAPAAESWAKLAEATGDYDVRDAAHVLARAGIKTGQKRLFQWLRDNRWLDARNRPYQDKVERGLIREKISSFSFKRTNGEEQLADPQVRITAKGLHELRRVLGGAALELEVAS